MEVSSEGMQAKPGALVVIQTTMVRTEAHRRKEELEEPEALVETNLVIEDQLMATIAHMEQATEESEDTT